MKIEPHKDGYHIARSDGITAIAREPNELTKAEAYIPVGSPGYPDGLLLCSIWNHQNCRYTAIREVMRRAKEIREIEEGA